MLTACVLSFAILAVTAFCVKRKNLHIFEILGIWFTVTAVNSPLYSYFLINRHWISVPDSKELAGIRIIYNLVLNPLFIAWVLDEVVLLKRFSVRAACYAVTIAVLFLGGWTLDQWGVVRFREVGWWVYAPFKTFVFIAALCSVRFVSYVMRKDGIRYDKISNR